MAAALDVLESGTTYELKAVIDIGSTSIRMVVAQVYADGKFQTLDALNQSVAIGSDTFTRGRISRSTIEDSVKVLRSFALVLKEYNIDLREGVRAVATSAVREARNRDEFLDRSYMATGINVEVIEGTEINRLTFLGIRPLLQAKTVLCTGRLLVAEVGGGSTELLGIDEGRVSFAHAYRMGSYRLREAMDAQEGSGARQAQVLRMEIEAGVRQCRDAVGSTSLKTSMLLMGSEARLAAGLAPNESKQSELSSLKLADLVKLAGKVLKMDIEQVARKYRLTYEEAQTLGPALEIYIRMAEAFGLKSVYVCGITLRDGLLAEAASLNAWTEDFVEQILYSVREIGKKYSLDQAHADCVTGNALALFRAMEPEHGLGYRYEVLLMVAAQLHDVGMFIGSSSHHKHAQYIIENSDIFGLGKEDIRLTALVARYHRGALPRNTHPGYDVLTREKRLVVNKLASILRAADALDRSHTQSIRDVKVLLKEGQLVFEAGRNCDFAAEKRALISKGKMFEQVYGRTVVLRAKRRQG
ncbi:Ppx/GppA phosphatase family protein [Pontiella sulfatireligans]|uniref:Exopolyphosphatase n=1 Tax=Pontiella sulfatireligans TaxID=2750658 RepID=A0A6C2UFX4_9BACT|nr:Ppx/GppA phosphatase family protein [Pontiella sulfatireligans]VGO18427.1 Exopolyphosphatase [Pontiella sulfatireligans]